MRDDSSPEDAHDCGSPESNTPHGLADAVAEWIENVNDREKAMQPLGWVDGRYHCAARFAHIWREEQDGPMSTHQMAAALTEIRDNPGDYSVEVEYRVGSDGKGRWQPYKGVFANV